MKVALSATINIELVSKLNELSKSADISRSAIIEKALKAYFAEVQDV